MKSLFRNSNLKNVILLVSSIVIGKGLVLICTPFITRLYDPYLFGILALIMSYGRILAVVFSMRYELKFLNIEESERFNLLRFLNAHVFLFFLLSVLVCGLIVLGFELPMYYLLIPVVALLAAMYETNRMYNVSFKKFTQIAVSEVVRGFNQGLVPLIAFFSALFVPFGLVTAELSGLVGSIFSLAGIKRVSSILHPKKYLSHLKVAYKEMILTGPAKLLNVSTNEIIPIGIGFLYNNELLGLYFVARKIMGVPLSFITKAIFDVLTNSLSEIFLKSGAIKARNYLFRQFKLLLLAGLVFGLGVYLLIDFLVDVFLDESYEKVSQIIKLSLIYYCSLLVVKPLSNYFNIIGKFKVNLIWDSIRFSLVVLSFVIGWIMAIDFDQFIFLLSLFLFAGYLVFVLLLRFYKVE
ncbi:lipopolysaccharide biosynthesis protein [Gilvibacter sp.]|uniref:lipopolysaccharide biosynthesis protein n=1 Tax=Gilvibacter sp. TaxID=2729997 RepID=UPI003F49D07F